MHNILIKYILLIYSSQDEDAEDNKANSANKPMYKWSLDEVGSRARSERVSKFYGQFGVEAERQGISHASFAAYLGYR